MSFASIRRCDFLDQDAKYETQKAESGYLRKLLLIQRTDLIKSEEKLAQVARFHTCHSSCAPFKNLKPQERFIYQNKTWSATGYVFVCPNYGKIHICGIDDCRYKQTAMNCSNIVCSLTGLDLGVGVTLARTRLDQDLYDVGGDLVSSYIWSRKTEGVTETQAIKKIENTVDQIQEAYESNAHKVLSHLNSLESLPTVEEETLSSSKQDTNTGWRNEKKRPREEPSSGAKAISLAEMEEQEPDFLQGALTSEMNETDVSSFIPLSSSNSEEKIKRKRSQAKKTIDKTVPTAESQRFSLSPISLLETTSTLFQELLQASGGKESDVIDITTRFPFIDIEAVKKKLISRNNLRRSANLVWDVYAVTKSHLDLIETRVKKATAKWRKFVIDYYQKCGTKGELPDKIHIMNIFKLDVLVHYEGVYYGGDVPEINRKIRPYIIDSMVKLWEKFEETPGVLEKQIPFDACCAALLNSMNVGLKIEVYLLGNNPKPMIWGNMTIPQQRKAVAHTITFINPHPTLILKETDHVRKDIIEEKKKRVGKVSRPIGGKMVYASRQRASSGGKTNNLSQIIPSMKNLYAILDVVVENAQTIQALEKYCLSKLQNNNFYPMQ
jgi:predicted RNA-binding Zn-ribbon protein involved in translation (DUF1610 family)